MTGALGRAIRRGGDLRSLSQRCDLCSVELLAGHRHLLDTERQEIRCVCQACTLLFERAAAGAGHYRLLPRRRLRLPPVATGGLGVPVGLAYVVVRGDVVVRAGAGDAGSGDVLGAGVGGGAAAAGVDGIRAGAAADDDAAATPLRVEAHYPSPAGLTRWEVDGSAWAAVVAGAPPLAGMSADVEAFLVNVARGRREHWLVPIDDCFALVAVVRRQWRGLSGGDQVWTEIDRFFAGLTERRR